VLDFIWFLVDFILTIVTASGYPNLIIAQRSKFWVLLVRLFLVDLLRCVAFVLLLHFDLSRRSRHLMFLTRLLSLPVEFVVMIYAYAAVKGESVGALFYFGILLSFNIYFGIVIYSYYRLSEQDEIQLELQRFGADKIGIDLHELQISQKIKPHEPPRIRKSSSFGALEDRKLTLDRLNEETPYAPKKYCW